MIYMKLIDFFIDKQTYIKQANSLPGKILLPFLFLFLFKFSSTGQPVLRELSKNGSVINHLLDAPKVSLKKETLDTLQLPYFEDFTNSSVYPSPDKWIDRDVFINDNYAILPPSIGTATFDLLDWTGNLHENASSNTFGADSLTSLPMDLEYPANSNIYFSFFYQPQGFGDAPEQEDSLILEFYSPLDSTWYKTWSKAGSGNQPFNIVMLPITDSLFLTKGFRFRFHNLGSLSKNLSDPGRVSNADHWHVDYIYINTNRSPADTIFNDVAFVEKPSTILKTYRSLPWSHAPAAFVQEFGKRFNILLKNNGDLASNVHKNYIINDLFGPNDFQFSGGANNVPPFDTMSFYEDIIYNFELGEGDKAVFEITSYLITDELEFSKVNDTVVTNQVFKNYYSYDDGSAEKGYGISGTGANNAMTAVKFHSFKADTLAAIQMYFNDAFDNVNERYNFWLSVWDDNDGIPGDVIYSKSSKDYHPFEPDSLNKFSTYKLDSTIILQGDFHVGFIQTKPEFINLGFDINGNSQNKKFYNIYGDWSLFNEEGALMIRPVFGSELATGIAEPFSVSPSLLTIYPNPARDYINLQLPGNQPFSRYEIFIFNVSGKMVYKQHQGNQPIDISNLPKGLYLLKVSGDSKTYHGKFIISR